MTSVCQDTHFGFFCLFVCLFSVEMESHELFGLDWPEIEILISASCVAGMTSMHHHAQLLVEMWSHKLFCLGWP
jgi:hypothetical protein